MDVLLSPATTLVFTSTAELVPLSDTCHLLKEFLNGGLPPLSPILTMSSVLYDILILEGREETAKTYLC